jgi:hypothetical protein
VAADITLISGSLAGVVTAIRLSRATMRNIRQNLFLVLAYNIIGIPVAAGLLYPLLGIRLSPIIAAVAMALSSLSVVGNANRLPRWRPRPAPRGRTGDRGTQVQTGPAPAETRDRARATAGPDSGGTHAVPRPGHSIARRGGSGLWHDHLTGHRGSQPRHRLYHPLLLVTASNDTLVRRPARATHKLKPIRRNLAATARRRVALAEGQPRNTYRNACSKLGLRVRRSRTSQNRLASLMRRTKEP